ncbi:hypothetical protein ACFE04_028293 [Oxalis oulophora]
MDLDWNIEKKRVKVAVFFIGLIVLSFTAEKCRLMVGEEASSKSGKFTWLNCFDLGSGSVACSVKEGVKLYVYSMRSKHVERARQQAIENALADAVSQGFPAKDAAKQAQKEGVKAAKLASRQAKRIVGPIISSGWDFFEAIYYGGTITEGFLRGTGTLFGAYGGGFLGEQKLGKIGYLVGSHLGSWVGGRIGLMVYDVVNGLSFLLNFGQSEESANPDGNYAASDKSENQETPFNVITWAFETFLASQSQQSENQETPVDENFIASQGGENQETPFYQKVITWVFESFLASESQQSENHDTSDAYETPSFASSEDSGTYESPSYETSEEVYENSEL